VSITYTHINNADGTGLTRLTNNTAGEIAAHWSPNGSQIVFVSDRDGNNEIYTMNADGSSQTNLTQNSAIDAYPVWSPDGLKMAFNSDRDGTTCIYTMNAANGSSPTSLAVGETPSWSPDGTKIAFINASVGLIRMDANGANSVTLTTSGMDMMPVFQKVWSPDGATILFESARDGNPEIYAVGSAGGGVAANLTQSTANDSAPAWSSDGKKIAFSSNRAGSNEIWVMNADGTGPVSLTSGLGALGPCW